PLSWGDTPSGIDGDVGLFIGCGFGEVLADDRDQFVELGSAAVEKLLPRDHSTLAAITIRVVPLEVQSNDGAPPKHCHLGKVSPRVKTLVKPLMHSPELTRRPHFQIHQPHHARPCYGANQ